MLTTGDKNSEYPFPANGGQMGQLMRSKNWNETVLGDSTNWPLPLRFAINIMTDSALPMAIYWGKDFVFFCNDAWLPFEDKKHPPVLGKPAREIWSGWNMIEPLFSNVLATGTAIRCPEAAAVQFNNFTGQPGFDYTLNPLRDEQGHVAGILSTVTFHRPGTENKEDEFRRMVMQAPVGIAILRGTHLLVELANPPFMELVDRHHKDFAGKRLMEALPELEEQGIDGLLQEVLKTGQPYYGNEFKVHIVRNGKKEDGYFNFVFQPLREEDGRITGIIIIVNELTGIVKSKHVLAESEKQFRNIVMQSPIPMTIFRGSEYIIEMANAEMFKNIWHKEEKDIIGKKALEVFPELNQQKYPQLMREVFTTGKPYHEKESIAFVRGDDGMKKFYFDYEYAPLFEPDGAVSGIMITVNNVTEKIEARKKIEEAEQRSRLAIEAAEIGTFEWDLITDDFINSIRLNNIFGLPENTVFSHKKMLEIFHPGDKPVRDKAVADGLKKGSFMYEARLVWPDTSIHWIKVNGKILYDAAQMPYRIYGTAIDITDEKNANIALEESRERFKTLLESMMQMTWTNLPDGNVNFYNQQWYNYTGLNFEETKNSGWAKVVHPDDFPHTLETFTHSLQSGEIFVVENRYKRGRDNQYRWHLNRAMPIKNEKDEIVLWIGTATDIHEQKLLAEELKESEARFRLLANFMPQFIWTGDSQGKLNYFNEAVYNFSGLTEEEIKNGGWINIVHPDDREENISKWIHSVSTGDNFIFEHRFRRYDGEYRWQLSRALAQKDNNGDIQMWVGTSTDIHDLKEHEQLKDDFISMASHELKTPITSIKGYVQLLLKVSTPESNSLLSNALTSMDKQVSRLTKLITDLLDLTKINSGGFLLEKEVVNMNELTREMIEDVQNISLTHSIILHEKTNRFIRADKDRISQVLINLLTNAIKYSPLANKVIVEITSSTDQVIVSVQDFGIGIAKEDQYKIFERFYRVHGKEEKTFPGFGIGLFIVNDIIKRHSGKIWIESEKNRGSVFYFSLPFVTPVN